MAANSFTSWQGGGDPNGLLGPTPVFRSAIDKVMVAWGAGPDTQYPDGYLGTQPATSRRSDKLLNSVHRTNSRPYSRGVHKGERVNPGDYIWPVELNLWSGLEFEAKGMKWAPVGADPVMLTNDGKAGPRGIPRNLDRPQMEIIDQQRRSRLKSLAPGWK
jgi:hypothetical protein